MSVRLKNGCALNMPANSPLVVFFVGGDDQEVSCLQPPKDLPVSINTEEMKINQLVELQRRYKEKKKEFDKLQRKKDKK